MPQYKKSFRFREDRLEYGFQLKRKFPWWILLLLLIPLLLFIPLKKDITVHVVAGDGTPIDSAMVELTFEEYYHGHQNGLKSLYGQTDAGGTVVFCDIMDYPLWMLLQPSSEAVVTGNKSFLSAIGSFKRHWKKEYTLVLNGEMVIEVRSREKDQPIPGAALVMAVSDMDTRQLQMIADQDGIAKYIIHDPAGQIDTLLVTQRGYSGSREVYLAYDSIQDLHHIVYLDPPKRCGWAANNDTNSEKMTILDYDMGQTGGKVRFNYYTHFDADVIEVYDGSSSDYSAGTAPLLFRCDWATETESPTDYEILQFSGQYICVVVQKLSYYWGYTLNCPE